MARIDIEQGIGIRDLINEMKAAPERLDKDMRASFRRLAITGREDARAVARREHPVAKTRKHKGEYKWKTVVNAIQSGADDDTPTLNFGSKRVPGWAGWEFGSDKLPNFGRREPQGRFFFPTVRKLVPDMNIAAEKIVLDYMDLFARI